ncbi:gamma-glutamylcyclotransferase family protein [Mucilaginibacter sp. PAMB04168]|uniref:gamma-glutamylcyclotransferase family protein n=1 Tax=Mucilaginibacter sp. PAMB04168 TaxID=3138567 RepID=UPI0031F607AC
MEYLFAYGTLLKHFENEVLKPLEDFLTFTGKGLLKGELYDLGEYPALIKAKELSQTVAGEVYSIDSNANHVLAALDEYEGAEYSRQQQWVRLHNGKEVRCWVYVYQYTPGPNHIKIIDGDYLAYIRNKVDNG